MTHMAHDIQEARDVLAIPDRKLARVVTSRRPARGQFGPDHTVVR